MPTEAEHWLMISIVDCDVNYSCLARETLLQGMARLGRKGIPAGCLNGGCGVCKVVILSGTVCKTGAMSRAHVSQSEEERGVVLACRVRPVTDVELLVVGKLSRPVHRTVRKSCEQ